MTHHDTHPGSRPEDRFDQWLDGLVAGTPADAASLNGTDGSLSRAMSGARQLHGLAAGTAPAAAAQRRIEESLMRSGTLAAPRGTTWIPIEKEARRTPWWSPTSPVIAAALVVALIVTLGASFIATQRPAEAPIPAPGFALASPNADDDVSTCSAPGYAPVVSGDLDAANFAAIGNPESVVRVTDDGVTVPLPDGGETTLPAGSMPVTSVPGTYLTTHDDGSRTVTSTALGETWAFPALDFSDTGSDAVPAAFSFVATGPYVAGPVDATGLDWRIVDVRTGEEITTSELLDGLFPWMVVPQSAAPRGDSDLQAITFIRATQAMPEITSEVVAPEGKATDRALNGTVAAILPGSLEYPEIVDLGGIAPLSVPFVSNAVIFSGDGNLAAWRGWDDNGEDEGHFAINIAPTGNLGESVVRHWITSPPASVDPLAFTPDGSELYLRDGMTIQALSVSGGTVREVFTPDAESMSIQAVNADAETVLVAQQGVDGVAQTQTFLVDLTTGEARHLPELDGFNSFAPIDATGRRVVGSATPMGDVPPEGSTGAVAIVDTATGEIEYRDVHELARAADGGPAGGPGLLTQANGYIVSQLQPQYGDSNTLTVIDGNAGTAWDMEAPFEPAGDLLERYRISPSGTCLLLTVDRVTGNDGDRIITEHVGSWIAPLEPDAEWTKLPFALEDWWPVPASDTDAVTIPAQDFATPMSSPEASEQDPEHVTSIAVTAKDDIYVSITVDGTEVYDSNLAKGDTAGPFTGSEFEVLTSSGVNTLFTNSCGSPPFNMGYENRDAYYILKADAASCPPEASPAASPAASGSCATSPPNGDIPPGENADLDWLGSGAENPSLWLMMTWDHGRIETNEVADGYPVKLTFWRGEGSGDVTVTATGPDGTELPVDTFAPFRGTTIPGVHPMGGTLPEPGCWTFTATDGNDTLTWTVDVEPLEATPVAVDAPSPVMVIEGTSGEARIENGIRIATLGDDGMTLPIEPGVNVALPEVVQVDDIWGHRDTLHVSRDDGTEAVIDLTTGDVLFEVEPFRTWGRDFGRWWWVPTDDTLTDWTVTDLTTGDTRLLSELIDLPGDSAVMPSTPPDVSPGDTQVFQVELGTPEATGWVTTDPAARTFVIAGSLDRVATLPNYPTLRDNVGNPTLVASADGGTVAYETRAGDSRVIVLDVTSGKVLARYSATDIGENPTLAGFSGDSQDLIVTTPDGRVIQLAPDGRQPMILHDGLGSIDNPLLFRDGSLLYVRQVDKLLMIEMLPDGVVREVSTGLVPDPFRFTTPRGNWIVAQTQDGHILIDARTGDVVSRMKPPANRAYFPEGVEQAPSWTSADGDTVIFAYEPQQPGGSLWLLSPDFPDGLEIPGPDENVSIGSFWLSPSGETLYAYTSERSNGPGTVWSTPLDDTPDWQIVAEDVTPQPVPMMFFPEG